MFVFVQYITARSIVFSMFRKYCSTEFDAEWIYYSTLGVGVTTLL